jgi:GTP-binding protein Era
MPHKAGFVNILGKPNVGKSTLMNALTGEKLSIISPKAQTTRHRIRGLVNGDDYQIVFTDTPGIVAKPAYKLHESMIRLVETALADADVFIYVVELGERPEASELTQKIAKRKTPLLLLINKIDLGQQQQLEVAVAAWKELLPSAEILPISALHDFNTDLLLKKIISLLPESEPYFPKDELTDQHERFFVAEILREKIFLNYSKEIPYSTEVEIDSYKEEEKITRIAVILHVMRESQKAILLGHQGSAMKKMATEARKDIEEFIGKHVFLELHIKVSKDWRNDEKALKKFGYEF